MASKRRNYSAIFHHVFVPEEKIGFPQPVVGVPVTFLIPIFAVSNWGTMIFLPTNVGKWCREIILFLSLFKKKNENFIQNKKYKIYMYEIGYSYKSCNSI